MNIDIEDVIKDCEKLIPKAARLRETDFNPYWLNRLLDKEDKTVYADWYQNVSTSPYIPVDVFDPATGDVLFTVPPLMSGELVDVSRNTNQPDAVEETFLAIQKEATHPRLAEQHMLAHVIPRFKIVTDPSIINAWKKVFDHYKIKYQTTEEGDTNVDNESVYDFGDD